jgi:hypothetical protein
MTEYMDIGCDAKRAPQSAVASEQPLQSTALAALDHALTAWWLTQTASSDHIRPMPSWRLGMHWREGASASCWQPLQGQAKPCWHQPSCPASWIGFVTDIVHEELDDGKTKQTKKDRDKIKLPKECPACAYLRPAGTNKCPNCGFEAKPQNKIRVVDGELKELNSAKRPTNGRDLKAEIYAQFKGYAEEKGYKPGFAYHKFREYFGEEPRGLSNVPSQSPSPEIRSWLKSRFIAFYKATHPPQVSQVQVGPWQRLPMPSGLPTSVARKVGAVYIARSFREMAGMQNVDIANFGV